MRAHEIAGKTENSAKCRDRLTYITTVPKNQIPKNESEYNARSKEFGCAQCPNKNMTYVTDRMTNKTIVLCSEQQKIYDGWCPELNIGKLQPNHYAEPCANFSAPCPNLYSVWDSYKYLGCFQNDTDSAKEQRNNCVCSCENVQQGKNGTDEHNTTPEFWEPLCIASLAVNVVMIAIIIVFLYFIIFKIGRKRDDPSMEGIKLKSENLSLNEDTLDDEEEGAGSDLEPEELILISSREFPIEQESFAPIVQESFAATEELENYKNIVVY